jgi:hypothetical protein
MDRKKMINDVSWERMAQLIEAHRNLVYPNLFYTGNEKSNDNFQVTAIRFNGRFKRPKCAKCGNLVARKLSSLKLWRKRGFLCRKCFNHKKAGCVK